MKKNKLLNLILRGGGGGGSTTSSDGNKTGVTSNSDPGNLDRNPIYTQELAPEPGVLVRQSTGRKNNTRPPPPVLPQLRPAVERSTSWKYTNDQTPDSFTVSSSPSILDAIRSQQEQTLEPQGTLIEKSQSWSGDRLLESTTDSGSNSRAGSGSRAGSRTGTLNFPRPSLRDRGSRSGSRVGSEHGGDSTPSSIYDHDHYISYTDADGYENVELSSPQKIDSGDNSSSHESGGKIHGSRLSVKGSSRRSRRPSPRRSPLAAELGDNLEVDSKGVSRTTGVRGTVPSISLSTSSPLLLRNTQATSPQRSPHRSPQRTPSQRSPASRSPSRASPSRHSPSPRSPSQRSPTIEIPTSASRSSSHSPSRSSSRMGSRRSSRSPSRPSRPISNERWHEGEERASPLTNNSRSLSYEEQNMKIPLPKPLWKTRSWQQPRNQALQISDRSMVSKPNSWQQPTIRVPQQVTQRLDPRPRAHNLITRQEALPPHVFTKSRSWQQSHEPEPVPEPLSRTYTVHDRRNPRRSSGRLTTPSNRGSTSVSPGRYPMNTQVSLQVQPGRQIYYQDDRSNYRQTPQRMQPTYATTSVTTANGPAEYVELRDYEILEKQQSIRAAEQYRLEQKRQEKIRQEQLRQENYLRDKYQQEKRMQNDHHLMTQDQYVRRYHQAPFSQQLSFSHAYSQPNYPQMTNVQHSQLSRQRSGSQRNKGSMQEHPKIYPPREFMNDNQNQVEEYASLRDVHQRRDSSHNTSQEERGHAPPIKSASLMSSVELLNTLKRQLALSSPTKAGRSKSMEAGRAAAAALASENPDNQASDPEPPELSSITLGSSIPSGRLSPALQALVAEKRARLKRSTVAFSGSGKARFAILRTIASPSTRCTVAFIPPY